MSAIVAIVGRPNVGKSTLFNRLIGERKALVHNHPGVTRDRMYGRAEAYGKRFIVVDTGGFEPDSDEGMLPMMREQAQLAVEEADITLFVVDGRSGMTPVDEQVFAVLRNAETPVLVCVNKIEGERQENEILEFHALGVDVLYPVSAEHGRGIGDLLDVVTDLLPDEQDEESDSGRTRIAVVGRPNAGKSTLINRLLGQNRLIVSEVAGTTRDSVDTHFERDERRYTLIDTVGIRRRKAISWAVEKFGVIKAMQAIERSHVAVLMVDATEGLSDQDARIANLATSRGRALVIVMNKWDLVDKDHRTSAHMERDIRGRRASLGFASILFVSAETGQRAEKVLDAVDVAVENWRRRITTAQINRWFKGAMQRRPPPLYKKRAVKLYYATQVRHGPPTFVLQSNMPPAGFPEAYLRYLVNQLRDTFAFEGTPIKMVVRQRDSKYKGKAFTDEERERLEKKKKRRQR